MSELSIDERFGRFHRANPEILQSLIDLSRAAKARGYRTYSLKALWEVLRFNANPRAAERYKLSNSFTSRYARLVMQTAADLQGFFTLRDLKSRTAEQARQADLDDLLGANDPSVTAYSDESAKDGYGYDDEPECEYEPDSEEDAA